MNPVIYGLVDPVTKLVRYVGYTQLDPKKRLIGHIKENRQG